MTKETKKRLGKWYLQKQHSPLLALKAWKIVITTKLKAAVLCSFDKTKDILQDCNRLSLTEILKLDLV